MSLALIIGTLGYLILAIVAIFDKFILTKSVKSASIYTFYSSIFFLALILLIPFSDGISLSDIPTSLLSGLAFGFGLWAMFTALKSAEASHISPFIGGMTAVATFLLSFILGEKLSLIVTTGVFVLTLGSVLLSYEKTKSHEHHHHAFAWALLSGILFAISHVCAKQIYESYSFFDGLIYTKAPIGFVGLLLLFIPEVRKGIRKKDAGKSGPLVITDKILGVIGTVLIQYAIAIGSVTVINAMAGIQYALIFLIAGILTKKCPDIFKEFFTKKEIINQVSALVIIIIGTVLISLQI